MKKPRKNFRRTLTTSGVVSDERSTEVCRRSTSSEGRPQRGKRGQSLIAVAQENRRVSQEARHREVSCPRDGSLGQDEPKLAVLDLKVIA